MVLNSVILPGVDPAEVINRSMIFSVGMTVSPIVIFSLSELISGQFSGFKFLPVTTIEVAMAALCLSLFVGFIPVCLWIQTKGVSEINQYLIRNGQILERQLLGALARVYRSSQKTKMIMLAIPTSIGLFDAELTRSKIGLMIYLFGQFLMIYNLPWPSRCEIWTEVKRREILR